MTAQHLIDAIAGRLDQFSVGFEINIAQQRHPALPRPDELAWPAQAQILPGNLETVGMLENDFQTLPGNLTQGPRIQQDATGFVGATSHPAA